MKLRFKTLFIVGTAILLFLTLLFFIIYPVLLKDSIELDETYVMKDIERISNNLDLKMEYLTRTNRDWAVWDDTYYFIGKKDPTYINRNLSNATFQNNSLNFMVFINNKNELIYQKAYDLETYNEIELEDDFYKSFIPIIESSIERNPSLISMTKYGPAMSSFQSVYKSSGDGPSIGTLIMGRFVNEAFINQIGNELSIPLTINQVNNSSVYTKPNLEVLSKNEYKGSIFIEDYLKKEAFQISFITERQFFLEKLSTIGVLFKYIGFSSLVTLMLVLGLLNKLIIARIGNLSSQLRLIQNNRDIKSRIIISGKYNDEITELEHSVNHMLTSLNEKHDDIEKLAYYDQLTMIPNRHAFFGEFTKEITQNPGDYAILFLDLDGFKRINDSLGHEVGDALLKQVSKRVFSIIEKREGIMARFGGDEFIIFLKYDGIADLHTLLESIIAKVGQEYELFSYKTIVTVSIGVSSFPDDGEALEILLQKADIAMYEAKRKGKNRYCFYQDLSKSIDYLSMLVLEHDLKFAIQRNQLELYYQIIVNGSDKMIAGVEALLRWKHPTKGMISPDVFIPIAEETGLMPSIGLWVLEESVRQIKKWHSKGYDHLSLAINISKSQMRDSGFLEKLDEVLHKYQLSPSKLQIEITESDVDHFLPEIQKFTKKLKKRKVKIALDDFGAGTSSLLFLKELPIHIVKIDRNFIKNVPIQSFDATLLSGILEVFKKLNMDVVVEGIETEEQLDYVAARINARLQGYYFSKPLPPSVLEEQFFGHNLISTKWAFHDKIFVTMPTGKD